MPGNVAELEKLVTDGLVDLLASILTLLGMVLVMVLANWQFTLFSILIGPALFVVVLGYTRSIKATTRRAAKAAGRVAEVAAEDIAAITEVKAFTPAPTATLVHAAPRLSTRAVPGGVQPFGSC